MNLLTAICVCATWAWTPTQAIAQQPSGREAIETMRFADLSFDPPVPDEYSIDGVLVLILEDGTLPLTSVYARFRGGYGLFGREYYAVGTAMPSLLRYGGTSSMAPDSVDGLLARVREVLVSPDPEEGPVRAILLARTSSVQLLPVSGYIEGDTRIHRRRYPERACVLAKNDSSRSSRKNSSLRLQLLPPHLRLDRVMSGPFDSLRSSL